MDRGGAQQGFVRQREALGMEDERASLRAADPTVAGGTLTWIGTFTLPAGTTRALTYRLSFADVKGQNCTINILLWELRLYIVD